MPFLITTCADDGEIRFWEFDVDPMTRRPHIPDGDLQDVAELLDAADLIYMQNAKFDYRALLKVGIELPWVKVRDTLAMGHLLASNHPHDLTWMCMSYLGVDIEPHEVAVKEVTQACRAIVKRDYPDWRIATEGLPEMPSVKAGGKRDEDKPWKNDMWLPRALVMQWDAEGRPVEDERWLTACSAYANADSEHTLYIGIEMERLIRERGYWDIYLRRLELPRVACEMECYGLSAIGDYTDATIGEFEEHVAESDAALKSIAADYGHDLELAAGASLNDNMRDFFYGAVRQECVCGFGKRVKHWNGGLDLETCPKCAGTNLLTIRSRNLALPVVYGKKSGGACLDKDVMQDYLTTTDGAAYDFVKMLADKRKYGTDLTYMHSYRRFWVPDEVPGYYRVHPSLNPFATDHLRWASNSPNLQNVSKQEDECGECDGDGCDWCRWTGKSRVSVRYCFGPRPDREWWSIDFESIERRIPAFESGEPKMIQVFEKPKDAPYFGSLYLLTASVLYPEEFWPVAEEKGRFRKDHPRLYKRAKFCDLAKQYGCGKRKYDSLSGIKGSFDMVDSEFPLLTQLQGKYLDQANRLGYVETIPNRSVDPSRGYPILASRTDDGRVLSTTPFNYHTSGTACDCKNSALIRCSAKCAGWRRDGFDANIPLEIHDEILFDFPRGADMGENRWRAMELKRLMEMSGDDIGFALPCAVEYHPKTWANGIPI